MAFVNSWQRAEAINATNEIIGPDADIAEYRRVLDILERCFGDESDAIRVLTEYVKESVRDVMLT
jgi:hypothetical protein